MWHFETKQKIHLKQSDRSSSERNSSKSNTMKLPGFIHDFKHNIPRLSPDQTMVFQTNE